MKSYKAPWGTSLIVISPDEPEDFGLEIVGCCKQCL